MNQFVTFHDILNILEDFQVQSPILNSFGYGNLVDFGRTNSGETQNITVQYPYLFVVPQSIQYDENTTTYQLTLIFADILNTDMSNQKDCVSNMSLEAKRLLSYIKFGQNTFPEIYNSFDVELPSSAVPFLERMGDHVAGVALDANIIVFEVLDACDYYPTPTPSPIPPTPTTTPTNTPTMTPTTSCPITTQYLEVELFDNTKFKLILWNDAGFTSAANALCDYQISGTAYGSLGTVYSGVETINSGQHQHQFNLGPILQPGEVVTAFDVYSYSATTCVCPVNLILPAQPTPTPTMTQTQTPTNTPTQTNTQTPTTTPTMTPTPSSTATIQTCDLYYFSGSTTVQYTPCSGGTVNEVITGGQYRELLSGTLSYTGDTPQYISPAPSVTYIDALETAGYTATTQEQQYITEFFNSVYTITTGDTAGYGSIQYMYPMIGGTEQTCKINAINPGTDDLTFYNSPTFDMSGVTWNGTNQYALIGTGKTQSDIGSSGYTHACIYNQSRSAYNTQFGTRTFTPDSRYFSRGIDASNFIQYTVNWDNLTSFGGSPTITGNTGSYMLSRPLPSAGTGYFGVTVSNYAQGAQLGGPVATTNVLWGVGCSFTDGNAVFEYDQSKVSFYSFGYWININLADVYNRYVDELQTKLGRQAH